MGKKGIPMVGKKPIKGASFAEDEDEHIIKRKDQKRGKVAKDSSSEEEDAVFDLALEDDDSQEVNYWLHLICIPSKISST
jgi:hypothetical protein